MSDANTYEPGPSFVENDRPEERLTEMPAWLQTFAAQEDTRDEDPGEEPVEASSSVDASPDVEEPVEETDAGLDVDDSMDQLPDWLTGDIDDDGQFEPDVPEEPLVSFDDPDDSISAASFIDEDDLPDWLRAFSDESSVPPPSPAVASINATHQVPSTGAVAIRVPPVENIWLPSYERKALGPGGTLFAMLASNTNGTIAHDDQTGATEQPAGQGASERPQGPVARRAASTVDEQDVEAAPQKNSMRLLLLTLLVVALVVLVSFLFFS